MFFEVLSNNHDHTEIKDGQAIIRRYSKGDVIKSDKQLDEVFQNKFRQVAEPKQADVSQGEVVSIAAAKLTTTDSAIPAKKEVKKEKEKTDPASYGKNVTKRFKTAAEKAGVEIYSPNEDQFLVFEPKEERLYNDGKPLEGKKALLEFLRSLG